MDILISIIKLCTSLILLAAIYRLYKGGKHD